MANWFTTEFEQLKHPVYNSLGREIGYFTDLATLATGHIQLYSGEIAPRSDQLMINCGFFAQRKNAGECLLSQGLTPAWATPQAVDSAVVANQPFGWNDLIPSVDLNPSDWTLAASGLPAANGVGLGTVALWGGLGLLGLLIVRRSLG